MTTRRIDELPAVIPAAGDAAPRAPAFESVYDAHADFVWRSARRLGVAEDEVEDVVQEVFLTVHRRLAGFEGRSQLRTWIFGVLLHVVRAHRRTDRRKGRFFHGSAEVAPESIAAAAHDGPEGQTERAEAARLLQRLLDGLDRDKREIFGLDRDKREIFVLVELEDFSVAEAAEILGLNVNTTHGRLRAARREFERLAALLRAERGEQGDPEDE